MSSDEFGGTFEDSEGSHAINRQAEGILRSEAIVECFLCDDDGYRGHHVCDHVDHAPAAVRGMAKVRAALAKHGGQ